MSNTFSSFIFAFVFSFTVLVSIKSENKETILKLDSIKDGYKLTDIAGININKLDKGCLIFNTDKANGFQVSIIDNTNKSDEAKYWRDDFLSVQPKKNEYHQTNNF